MRDYIKHNDAWITSWRAQEEFFKNTTEEVIQKHHSEGKAVPIWNYEKNKIQWYAPDEKYYDEDPTDKVMFFSKDVSVPGSPVKETVLILTPYARGKLTIKGEIPSAFNQEKKLGFWSKIKNTLIGIFKMNDNFELKNKTLIYAIKSAMENLPNNPNEAKQILDSALYVTSLDSGDLPMVDMSDKGWCKGGKNDKNGKT